MEAGGVGTGEPSNLTVSWQANTQSPKLLQDDLSLAAFQSKSYQVLSMAINKSPMKILAPLILFYYSTCVLSRV